MGKKARAKPEVDVDSYKGPGFRACFITGNNSRRPGDGAELWLYTPSSPIGSTIRFARTEHLQKFARWLTRAAKTLEPEIAKV